MPRKPEQQRLDFVMQQPLTGARISQSALKKLPDSRLSSQREDWHGEAFNCYKSDVIPEVSALINAVSSGVSACRLRVGIQDEKGEIQETCDPRVIRVLTALVGPLGGQEELLRSAALLMEITGDCFFVGTPLFEQAPNGRRLSTDQYVWEFLSSTELDIEYEDDPAKGHNGRAAKKISKATRYPDGAAGKKSLGSRKSNVGGDLLNPATYIARMWRRDPQFSNKSDSALRKALGICHELIRLTELVEAVANSRLHAGILYIPEEMSFGPIDDTMGPDQSLESFDELTEELELQLTAPIEDHESQASLVPLIMRGKGELGQYIKHFTLDREFDKWAMDLRKEAIDRLAGALNAPREVIEGKSDANHWSGANIDSEFATKTILPLGRTIASFLTVAYLRKMLVECEGMSETTAARYHIIFDASPIIARTDKATLACTLWEKGEISADSLRRHTGFEDNDAPGINERRQRLILDLITAAPVSLGPLLIDKVNGLEDVGERLLEIEKEKARAAGEKGNPDGRESDDPDGARARDREDENDNRENDEQREERPPGSESEPDTPSEAVAVIVSMAMDSIREQVAGDILKEYKSRGGSLAEDYAYVTPKDMLSLIRRDDMRALDIEIGQFLSPKLVGFKEILMSKFPLLELGVLDRIMGRMYDIFIPAFPSMFTHDGDGLYITTQEIQNITDGVSDDF